MALYSWPSSERYGPRRETYLVEQQPNPNDQNVVEFQYQERGIIMDPIAARFVSKAEQGPPLQTLAPQKAMENLNKLQSGYQIPSSVQTERKILSVGPTGQTTVKIFKRKGLPPSAPAVVYIHGGGFVMGSVITHARLASELALCLSAVIIFVEYTLAPQGKFPLAHNQSYAVLKYVYENPHEFNIDKERISIGGDSVGGSIAAVCTIWAKRRRGPHIESQILFYPAVNLDAEALDYGDLEYGPWLSKANLNWAWSKYLSDSKNLKAVDISPVYATPKQLQGLPKALIITGDCDPLHKSGEEYAKKLMVAGVDVTATRYFGITHDFMMLNALKDTPAAKGALAEACAFFKHL